MSGHTPGPWVAIPLNIRDNYAASKPIFPEGLWRILPERNVERCPIAEVDRADDHDLPTRLSAEADARLIAAAPDLLEALQALLADCGDTMMDGYVENSIHSDDVAKARAAITKATGEPA